MRPLLPGLLVVVGAMAPAAAAAEQRPGAQSSALAPDEVRFQRSGFALGVAAGPGLVFGVGDGLSAARGLAGHLSLRVGTTATRDLLWVLQLDTAAHSLREESGASRLAANPALTLGGQYYLRETFWLRAGAGVSSFLILEEDGREVADSRRDGLAVAGSGGFDMFRRGLFALDFEVIFTASAFSDGILAHGAMQLAANWY